MSAQPTDKERIFTAALELTDPAERRAYLEAECGQDRQLLAQVEALLKHDEEAGSFIERPAIAPPGTVDFRPVTEGPGTVIGPYKLLQKIGEGGFGVVYMAEQQQPVRRKVALKIIKPGMDTREVIARFESERQALALMDHPNIARVLDAGATESGRPYFVMELVKGVPITEYCDKNNLPTEQRLQLFLAVCQAVQHAHQKGVIHRDIKPSNVMVTLHDGKPVPKVIDFGVAKATSQQLTEKTLFTAYGQMIGTPVYMSPEQAEMSGLDIDTRSDIYSLGVLLYELLTGSTPFDGKRLRDAGYIEMQRIIREEEPPRPSTRVSTMGAALTVLSNQRSTDPGKLRQLLRGDLDLIVMKALEKERTRRYETPSSFAQDVERFLNHEAILARPQSSLYRLRKFAQRNKAAVASGTAIAAALLLGTAASTILAIQAVHQRNMARENLIALRYEQAKTEEERQKAVNEANRAGEAERLLAEQKRLADERAKEAEESRATEAELRKNADDKRRAIEQQSKEIVGLNDRLRRSMEDQRRAIYAAEMNLVRLEAQRGNLPRLRELLMQQIPGADEEDLRGWEWTYWYRFLHRAEVVYRYEGFVYDRPGTALAVAPEGRLAAATRGERTEWIELKTGKVIGSVPVRLRLAVNRNSLSRGGRLVEAVALSQAAFRPEFTKPPRSSQFAVWEPTGEKRTFTLPEELTHLSFVQLSDDGSRVAAVGNDAAHQPGQPASRLLVWNVESGELLLNQVRQQELNRLTLSEDGKLLVGYVCHGSKRDTDEQREVASLIDIATGQMLASVRHNDDIDSAFLLPGGQRVVLSTLGFSGSNLKDLLVWNVGSETPEKLTSETMPDYVKGAVSPDGRLFAVGGHTVSKVRVFEIDSGRLMATLHNEATTIDTLTFSADSQQLIASSTSGEVLCWDLNQDSDLFRLRAKPLGSLAYSGCALTPDQSLLAYVTATGSVRLRTPDGTETVLDPGNPDAKRGMARLAFSPDGKFLAFATDVNAAGARQRDTQAVHLYDVGQSHRIWRTVPATTMSVQRLLFTADQQHLLLEPSVGPIMRLECASGKFAPLPGASAPGVYARTWTDRQGQMLVAARTPGFLVSGSVKVVVRELLTGQVVGEAAFPAGARQYNLVGSPDGQQLAIICRQPDSVEIWNFRQSQRVVQAQGNAIVFSHDGKQAAIGEALTVGVSGIGVGSGGISRFKSAQIWDLEAFQPTRTISFAGNHADDLRFSPDGRRLLSLHGLQAQGTGGAIPEVRLWDIDSGREIMSIPVAEVNHYMWDAYYDPTGNRLTILVFAKSAGTGGGWGSTVLDATPLSKSEDAQLVARRRVKDLLSVCPLPSDAIAALQADSKLEPAVREAALAIARRQPVSPETLASFCITAIAQFETPAEYRQAALRCAQALFDLEPQTLRSRVLLGGAQFRADQFQDALATLNQTTPTAKEDNADDDRLYSVCSIALHALVQYELGNSSQARLHSSAASLQFRAISSVASSSLGSLASELVNESTFFVGTSRFSDSSGFFVGTDVLKRAFERMDKNQDGQLTEAENTSALWSDLVAQDANRDGQLTLAEFTAAMQMLMALRREPSSGGFVFSSTAPLLDYDQQLAKWQALIEKDPENASALASRAVLLAACPDERIRNGKQALLDATQACELTQNKNPLFFGTLAMAHAELGDFSAAVKCQEQALAGAPPALRNDLTARLELYRKQKPYRLPGRYGPVEGWGRGVDPLGDCEVVVGAGTLRIKVPGSMHNLHPLQRGMDAPRVLREVEGDFTAEVKVTCPIQPQNSLPGLVTTCHGAGVLMYDTAEHFLRVERDGFFQNWDNRTGSTKKGRSRLSSNAPTIEYWQRGTTVVEHSDWDNENPQLPGESTWLRLERRGLTVRVFLSHDGQSWKEIQKIETTFPAKVQLGVHAINSSADAFEATFSNWKLTQP